MDITKAEKIVMFSYVPLLYAPPQMLLDELSENNIEAVAKFVESLKDGNAIGCLWVDHGGQPSPVFLYPNAHEIAEHLHLWTEEKPTHWFRTHLKIKDGKYLIILMPQIDKSVERWKINFQLTYGYPPPKDLKFEVFFKPLYFVSGTENTLEVIKDEVTYCPNIGFMNMDSFDFDNPDNTNPDAIVWLGPFRKFEGDWAGNYLDSILDDASEPADRKSILFDAGKELKKKKNRDKRKRKRRK